MTRSEIKPATFRSSHHITRIQPQKRLARESNRQPLDCHIQNRKCTNANTFNSKIKLATFSFLNQTTKAFNRKTDELGKQTTTFNFHTELQQCTNFENIYLRNQTRNFWFPNQTTRMCICKNNKFGNQTSNPSNTIAYDKNSITKRWGIKSVPFGFLCPTANMYKCKNGKLGNQTSKFSIFKSKYIQKRTNAKMTSSGSHQQLFDHHNCKNSKKFKMV